MKIPRTLNLFSWLKVLSCLLVLTLVMGSTPLPTPSGAKMRTQPLLLALATQRPDETIRVIVQKWQWDHSLEARVIGLGGQVISDLPMINAFAAELPASAVPLLASAPSVRWLSLDAPVVRSSDDGDAVLPHQILLPLITKAADDVDAGQQTSDVVSAASQDQNYYLDTLGVRQVWSMGLKGQGVTVAVIDSGISTDKDFSSSNTNGRLVYQLSLNPNSRTKNDVYGHGTHVAGIIGGNGTDSGGLYVGIAPEVNLINLKISDENGMAYESDTVKALQWIYDNKSAYNIRVVNLSINSTAEQSYHTSPLNAAAEILWFNGVVVVASAGNTPTSGTYNTINAAPANDPFIITVGASNENSTSSSVDDLVSSGSAYGVTLDGVVKPDIVAPGTHIISVLSKDSPWKQQYPERVVYSGQYFRLSGTSMAAPMVAGAAALLLQDEPNLTPDQVKYRLLYASNTISGGLLNSSQYPYLNVYKAVTGTTTQSSNTGLVASQLLWTGSDPLTWGSVNWNSVNWNSVNWNSVNWNSVSWNSVNWNSVNWNP